MPIDDQYSSALYWWTINIPVNHKGSYNCLILRISSFSCLWPNLCLWAMWHISEGWSTNDLDCDVFNKLSQRTYSLSGFHTPNLSTTSLVFCNNSSIRTSDHIYAWRKTYHSKAAFLRISKIPSINKKLIIINNTILSNA